MITRVLAHSQGREAVDGVGLLLDQVGGRDEEGDLLCFHGGANSELSLSLELFVCHFDQSEWVVFENLEDQHDGHEGLATAGGHEHDGSILTWVVSVLVAWQEAPLLGNHAVDFSLVLSWVNML